MKSISDDFEIYKYKVSNWQEKKDKLIETFYKTNPRIYGNVITNFNSGKQNKFFLNSVIEKLFKNDIEKFLTDIDNNNYHLDASWMQLYEKNMSHKLHNHGNGYSSVIYIYFDKEVHSSTIFVDKASSKSFLPEVEEGDIIFFNSKHYHHCPTHKSDITRMICSFNLKKDVKMSYA